MHKYDNRKLVKAFLFVSLLVIIMIIYSNS